MAPSRTAASGICNAISVVPISAATTKPRTRMARSSCVSPAPIDCAVNATVLMRKKANSQNMQSNSTEAIATPPSSVASPSRPIAVVETMPISGVVRFAIIAGPAMANTCRVVTFEAGFGACISEYDHHAVFSRGVGQLIQPPEHVVAHMGEDQPLGVDLGQMRFHRFKAEMVLDDLVVVISLRNEQIGIARGRDQRLRPFGVSAIGDDASFGLDPVGE